MAQGQSIGFNFNSSRDNAPPVMTSTPVAGVAPSTGWVNIDGGGDATGQIPGSFSSTSSGPLDFL